MGKLEVKLHPATFHLNEIGTGLKFSLLNKNLEGVHPPVQCKDYIADVFWAETTKAEYFEIYGFKWTSGSFDITTDAFYLAVHTAQKELAPCRKGVQAFLNAFEDALDFSHSYVSAPSDTMLLFSFSREWIKRPILISAYLQLIRLGLYYEKGPVIEFLRNKPKFYTTTEGERVGGLIPKLEKLLKGKVPKQKWEDYDSVARLHNMSGLQDYIPGQQTDDYDDEY